MAEDGYAAKISYTGSDIEAMMLKHGYTRMPPSGVEQALSPTPTLESFADVGFTPEELRGIHTTLVTGEHKLEDYLLTADELSYIQQLSISQPQQTVPMHVSLAQEANGGPALTNSRNSPSCYHNAVHTQTQKDNVYPIHQDHRHLPSDHQSLLQQQAQNGQRDPSCPESRISPDSNGPTVQQLIQNCKTGSLRPEKRYSSNTNGSMVQQQAQNGNIGPTRLEDRYSSQKNGSMMHRQTQGSSRGPKHPHNQFPPYSNSSMVRNPAQFPISSSLSQPAITRHLASKRTIDQANHSNEPHIDKSNYALGDVLPMSEYPPTEGPGRQPNPQPNAGSAKKRQRRTTSIQKPRAHLPMPPKYNAYYARQRALMPPPRTQRPSYDHLAPELRPNPYRQPRPGEYAWFHGLDYTQQARIAHNGLLSDPLPEWPSLEGIEDLLQLQTATTAVVDTVPAARDEQEADAMPVVIATEKQDDNVVVPSARDGQEEVFGTQAGGVVTEVRSNGIVAAADRQLAATEATAASGVTEVQDDGIATAAAAELVTRQEARATVAPPDLDLGPEQIFDFDLGDVDNPFDNAMENWFEDFLTG